jgi:hypothetical protein
VTRWPHISRYLPDVARVHVIETMKRRSGAWASGFDATWCRASRPPAAHASPWR